MTEEGAHLLEVVLLLEHDRLAPDDTGQFRAVRKIQATIARPRWSSRDPATIDARANHCAGGMPQGGSMTTGATMIPRPGHSGKGGKIWGPGNDVANEPAPEGGVSPDLPAGVGDSNFGFKMTADDFAMLRNSSVDLELIGHGRPVSGSLDLEKAGSSAGAG